MDGLEVTGSTPEQIVASTEGTQNDGPTDAEVISGNPELSEKFNAVFGAGAVTPTKPQGQAGEDDNTPPAIAGKIAPTAPAAPGAAAKATTDATATILATLSPILLTAAKNAGWEDKDIADLYATAPDVAERTFDRLAAGYNDLSSQYAKLGAARFDSGAVQAAPVASEPADPMAGLAQLFTEDGMKKFAQENGQHIVDTMVKPLAAIMPQIQDAIAFVTTQKREALAQTVNGTLDGFATELPDLYGEKGKAWNELTPAQQDFRRRVVQAGDHIIAGAALQGLQISHAEALTRAHAMATAEKRGEIERKKLTATLQQRARTLTTRPTQRTAAAPAAGAATEANALNVATAKFAELGLVA